MRGWQRLHLCSQRRREPNVAVSSGMWQSRRAASGVARSAHLFHGLSPQIDVFVKRRPNMEGLLRAQFNSAIELTLVRGVRGTDFDVVTASVKVAEQKLQERVARTDPGVSLTQLLRQTHDNATGSILSVIVTELLEELDCTARIEIGCDANNDDNDDESGYGGAVYITDAWRPDPREYCDTTLGMGAHKTLGGLVAALLESLRSSLLDMRRAHVCTALREAQLRLTETAALRLVDAVFDATVPLSTTTTSPPSRVSRRAPEPSVSIALRHHQPTAQPLCALVEISDAYGTQLTSAIPFLSLRSRRDYVYTPHPSYPFLTISRFTELVDEGTRDGTVLADQWAMAPYDELTWWSFTLIARASPLYAFALHSCATASLVVAASPSAYHCFAHVPLSLEALVSSEGRVALQDWEAAKRSAARLPRASSLTRTTPAARQQATDVSHTLCRAVGDEIGWRHAPMVHLGLIHQSSRPFAVALPSAVAVHARSGVCHTVATSFASQRVALRELFPPSFAQDTKAGTSLAHVQNGTEHDPQKAQAKPAEPAPGVAVVTIRVPSLHAVLKAQGVERVHYAHGTLSCRNARGEDVVVFRELTTLEGYKTMLEHAYRFARGKQTEANARDGGLSREDAGVTADDEAYHADERDDGCFVTVPLAAETRNPSLALRRLLHGVMRSPNGGSESLRDDAAYTQRLRLPLPIDASLYASLRTPTRVERDATQRQLLSLLQHFSPDRHHWPLPSPPYTTFFTYWPITRFLLRNLRQNYTGFRYTLSAALPVFETASVATDGSPPPLCTAVFYQNESDEIARVVLPNSADALGLFYDQCSALARMSMADKTLLEVAPGFVLPQSYMSSRSRMSFQSLVCALFRNNESYSLVPAQADTLSATSPPHARGTGLLHVRLTTDVTLTLAQMNVQTESEPWREALARQFVEKDMESLVSVREAYNTVVGVAAALDMAQGETVQRSHVCVFTDHRSSGPQDDVESDTSNHGDAAVVGVPRGPGAVAALGPTESTWCEVALVARAAVSGEGEPDDSQLLSASGASRAEALMALAQHARHLELAVAEFQSPRPKTKHTNHDSSVRVSRTGVPLIERLQQRVAQAGNFRCVSHRHDGCVQPPRLVIIGEPACASADPAALEGGAAAAATSATPVRSRSVVIADETCEWCDVPRKLFALYRRALSQLTPATVAADGGNGNNTTGCAPLFDTSANVHEVYARSSVDLTSSLVNALNRTGGDDVEHLIKAMDFSPSIAHLSVWQSQLSLPASLLPCSRRLDETTVAPSEPFTLYTVGNSIRRARQHLLVALYMWVVCGDGEFTSPVSTTPRSWASPHDGAGKMADAAAQELTTTTPLFSIPTALAEEDSASPPSASLPRTASSSSSSAPVQDGGAPDRIIASGSLLHYLLCDLEEKLCALSPSSSPVQQQRGQVRLRLTHVLGVSLAYHVPSVPGQPRAASPRVKVRRVVTKPVKPVPLASQPWDHQRLHLVQLLELLASVDARITVCMADSPAPGKLALEPPRLDIPLAVIEQWRPLEDVTVMDFCVTFFRRYFGLRVCAAESLLASTPGQVSLAYDVTTRTRSREASTYTVRLRLVQFAEEHTKDARAAFSVSLCEVVGMTRDAALATLWTECARDIRHAFHLQRGATQEEVDSAVFTVANLGLAE